MAIARRLMAKGHDVEIVCARADVAPSDLDVVVLAHRAWTNHGRNARFSRDLQRHVSHGHDVIAGFDALEGLDVLYCANPPVRRRGVLDRINPRKRALYALEGACFGANSRTRLLLLSEAQRGDYDARWHLDPARVTVVPPTIERSRIVAPAQRAPLRRATRTALGLQSGATAWLFVGSFAQTKGLDRLLSVLPQFPEVRVLCVGQRAGDVDRFRAQAERAGVAARIAWLGVRDDIGALMVASDLLVHPSRLDITGTVILEAIANALPVVATAVCGYAPHVIAADAGRVVAEPFSEEALVAALHEGTALLEVWRVNAGRYADATDLTSGLDVAADAIAATSRRRP